jgi:hypothetical protein
MISLSEVLSLLQWAVPAGGIGAAVAWMANRKVVAAKATKAVHDTFKAMYADVSVVLEQTQKKCNALSDSLDDLKSKHNELQRNFTELEDTLSKAPDCSYYRYCPMRRELQKRANVRGAQNGAVQNGHGDDAATGDKLPADRAGERGNGGGDG